MIFRVKRIRNRTRTSPKSAPAFSTSVPLVRLNLAQQLWTTSGSEGGARYPAPFRVSVRRRIWLR